MSLAPPTLMGALVEMTYEPPGQFALRGVIVEDELPPDPTRPLE